MNTVRSLMLLLAISVAIPVPAEQPVGGEFQVNTYNTSDQRQADVARGPNGDFVVVWSSRNQDGDDFGVFGQRFDASGNALGAEFQVNTYTTDSQSEPAVSMDSSGDFVVVWKSWGQVGPWEDIIGRRFDASGSPIGGEFEVNTFTTQRQYEPDVASSPSGDFVVVWSGVVETGSFEIRGRRYAADGTPIGSEFQANTYTTERQTGGVVAVDGEGNFVVAWENGGIPFIREEVFGRLYDSSGNPLGGEFQINSYTTDRQADPAIARHPGGGFVAVWRSDDRAAADSTLFGRRFDAAGNPLGEEFQVNNYTTGSPFSHDVAMDAGGGFVVTWNAEEPGGSQQGVFAREFSAAGAPRGGQFQANTYTTGNQLIPAVAADADGDFVIAWQSAHNPTGDGVFARLYAGPGLFLAASGTCPGLTEVTVLNGIPGSEVGIVAAANTNGFIKGRLLCPGTELQVGEPFQLPPVFLILDAEGAGTALLELAPDRCWIQALALADCETSDTVLVPASQGADTAEGFQGADGPR